MRKTDFSFTSTVFTYLPVLSPVLCLTKCFLSPKLTGPIVRKLPRKLEVMEGENAVFCVEVENEEEEILWFKDGLQLREMPQLILKSFGRTHILVFVNVAHQDSGMVTFVAGRSKTSSRLKVRGAFRRLLTAPQPLGLKGLKGPPFSLEALSTELSCGSHNGRGPAQQRPTHVGPCSKQPHLHPIHLCGGDAGGGFSGMAQVFHVRDRHLHRGHRRRRAERRRLPLQSLLHQQIRQKWPC